MAYKMRGPLFFGKKRRAKKDAAARASAIESAKYDPEGFGKELESHTGKTITELEAEENNKK